jgi:hypothetical protein
LYSQRLFTKYVNPLGEKILGDSGVGRRGCRNVNQIRPNVREKLFVIRIPPGDAVPVGGRLCSHRGYVADSSDIDILEFRENRQVLTRNGAAPDDNSNLFCHRRAQATAATIHDAGGEGSSINRKNISDVPSLAGSN